MQTQIEITGTTATTVRPADNRDKLMKIDKDILEIVKSVDRSDAKTKEASARIIAAGVRMLDISLADPAAWEDFKTNDPDAKKIACKGEGREQREVATVIWRRHRKDPTMGRERVSVYGKAIRIAYGAFWETTEEKPAPECKTEDELIAKLQTLGIKGLLKIAATNKGQPKDQRISMKVPTRWTVYLIGPDRTQEEVPEDLAKLVINRMCRDRK